jgi:Transposase
MDEIVRYVGIDWGNAEHAICVIDAAGRRGDERRVAHTADAVQAVMDRILAEAAMAPAQIAIAIETPRGALIDACLAAGFRVFAVNPKQLDRFRDRDTVTGAKDDRRDAIAFAAGVGPTSSSSYRAIDRVARPAVLKRRPRAVPSRAGGCGCWRVVDRP